MYFVLYNKKIWPKCKFLAYKLLLAVNGHAFQASGVHENVRRPLMADLIVTSALCTSHHQHWHDPSAAVITQLPWQPNCFLTLPSRCKRIFNAKPNESRDSAKLPVKSRTETNANTNARRNHDVNENYKLLLIIPCWIENVA